VTKRKSEEPVEPRLAEFDELVSRSGLTVGVAESLTCGKLSAALGSADGSGEWLRGGVVCYTDDLKFTLLGVPDGPVVTRECAEQMARGAARLLDADLVLAVTGVGGPGELEGKPAGVVYIAVSCCGTVVGEGHRFEGPPPAVLESTIRAAIDLSIGMLKRIPERMGEPS
jgi:nicotinamide-nucleotide amidase